MADDAKAKGNAAFSSGAFNSAVNHFTDAINLAPTNHVLFSNRAAAHASLHHYDEALSDAKKTVELKPDWGKGYSRLGAAYLGLNQFEEAVEAFTMGLEIDPSNEGLKSGLADAKASEEKERKLKAQKEKGIGNGAYKMKDFDTAIQSYSTAMEIDYEDISCLTNRADAVHLEMGKKQMGDCSKNVVTRTSPSVAIVEVNPNDHKDVVPIEAPIVSSYNDRIRPLLDTVDRLRNLNVMREGIQLPTIVVVGDQSSGKSSVLESLAGISLPRGQGICTRVPLVMRLQQSSSPEPEIWLEYSDKVVPTDEENIAEAICAATVVIAGSGKGVSDTPLTLHVKKAGVPDITMVDLPGITRVPVNGQPENIYEQISGMVMKYIEPQESIILNVLSATVDFTTCESIRMSKQVDKTGERTLAVVTKADMAPEGLLQKVTADDVSIGLGYVCVRNRIGEETYEEARTQEELLFRSHPMLSLIDDEIVGIPVLAHKLVLIQATMIARCLPEIVRKVNEKMETAVLELNKLPKVMASSGEALMALMDIIGSAKESLLRILVQGDFSEYPDDQNMHCTARLAEKLNRFSEDLQAPPQAVIEEFLMVEIKHLEECKCIGLPNFIPRSTFLAILSQHVDAIHAKPVEFIKEIWDYIELILLSVITKCSENFPQIQSSIKRAGRNLMSKTKEQSVERIIEIVEMEKLTDYTCNPDYMTSCTQKTSYQQRFINSVLYDEYKPECLSLPGFGDVKISHLRNYHEHLLQQAFDMKMRISSYWTIVLRRIVDNLALYLQFSVKNLVNSQFQKEIVAEMIDPRAGGGIERMLEESPSMASKREKLKNSIKLLKESKDVVAAIVDQNSGYGDC